MNKCIALLTDAYQSSKLVTASSELLPAFAKIYRRDNKRSLGEYLEDTPSRESQL